MFCQRCGNGVPDNASFCAKCGFDLAATTPMAALDEPPSKSSDIELIREALKDDYEVAAEIGRGGMATVYQGRETMLDRDVAIKVLPFRLAHDEEFVERFLREARTAASLEHPHIIPVYRVGRKADVIFFAMRLIKGQSLSEVIDAKGALDPATIRKILVESASALGYAHAHGIVHRDIKPDNIMFRTTGQAVLCDFGIAKAASGTRLTSTGMAIGTPYYMSPEQARAQTLDGRSDLYSLGVVAYQCLTGSVPYDGEDSFSIGYKHIMDELPTPTLESEPAKSLYAIIERMMAKDPNDRYQTAEALVAALVEGVAAHETPGLSSGIGASFGASTSTPGATPHEPRVLTTPTTPMPPAAVGQGTADRRGRTKGRTGAMVAAAAVIVGAGGVAVWQWQGGSTPGAEVSQVEPRVAPPVDSADSFAGEDSVTVASMDSAETVGDPSPPVDPDTAEVVVDPPSVGTITLSGLGPDARVWLDDAEVSGLDHSVPPGRHVVRAERSGYEDYEVTVDVAAGEAAGVAVRWQAVVVEEPDPPPPPESQCEAFDSTYNANRECFDTQPVPQAAPLVPLTEEFADYADTPRPITVLVQVQVDGTVAMAIPLTPRDATPADSRFAVLASEFARQLEYRPATKDGQPVMAWKQESFTPRSR